jgi:glycosyltransferase involved in cell wall biosynthesis
MSYKVVLLSVADSGGGAFNAFMGCHNALKLTGIDKKILVMIKNSADPDVLEIQNGYNLYNVVFNAMTAAAFRIYPNRPSGFEGFSIVKSPVDLSAIPVMRSDRIIHLHWVNGMVGWPQASEVFQNRPIVWTLHDMNPFTGGCHCTAGCEKFKTGCNNCPQLGTALVEYDLAAENFNAKKTGYAGLNLIVVTPSQWLVRYARESVLLGAFPQCVIPNSVDVDTFKPSERNKARTLFNLPLDAKVVLFCAYNAANRNKGCHLLMEAFTLLREQYRDEPLFLFILGEPPSEGSLPRDYDYRLPGFITDKKILAAAYGAADVFVLSSFQDNLPNTLLEAQACGTPGIGFYGTGAEDIIQDGVTGRLVKHPGLPLAEGNNPEYNGAYFSFLPESIIDLAAKIKWILDLPPEKKQIMRHACREHAVLEYSPFVMAERYLNLYQSIWDRYELSSRQS